MSTKSSGHDRVALPPLPSRRGRIGRATALLTCVMIGAAACAQGSAGGEPSGSGSPSTSATGSTSIGALTTVTGADGSLVLLVPSSWTTADTTWTPSKKEIDEPALIASTDPASFASDWTRDGVFMGASPALAEELDLAGDAFGGIFALSDWHGRLDFEDCERDGAANFERDGYDGFETFWSNCGGVGTKLYDVAVATPNLDAVLHVLVQVSSGSPLGADDIDAILDGFEYQG